MPEKKPKPELLPCPFCGNEASTVSQFSQYVRCKRGACPLAFKVWIAIEEWNSRPVSELERLAREVIAIWVRRNATGMVTNCMADALDALAAHFAEPQKGKV